MQCVRDCDTTAPKLFEQPTLTMFVGETGCLAVYLLFRHLAKDSEAEDPAFRVLSEEEAALIPEDDIEDAVEFDEAVELKGVALFLLWLPTICDLLATSLMNVGLLFVSASIYQMLRGSVVIFTGIFSRIFLGRKHPAYRWFALATVFVGVSLVGAASIFEGRTLPETDPSQPHNATSALPSYLSLIVVNPANDGESISTALLGVTLVILAQCFTATQFVVEEKVLSKYRINPLKAVGFEGIFGLLSGFIALPPLYYFYGQHQGPDNYFNIVEGFREVFYVPVVFYTGIAICFSISMFNWSGLSVTQNVSATSRSTIDTCRTVFIWAISMGLGWESFKWLQVTGFVVLIYGTFVFNDVVAVPSWLGLGSADSVNSLLEEDLFDD
ncbi:hypothetical protein HK100_011027 [Physocladia obscura]|uniref:Integral membrane protein n=1 Tax=Physocladia obscura TaxID=109957 RepID=A0AAD5T4S9_9FUNG|nr:hypothetical protein HK100_011027 [Physocladia obscura]